MGSVGFDWVKKRVRIGFTIGWVRLGSIGLKKKVRIGVTIGWVRLGSMGLKWVRNGLAWA